MTQISGSGTRPGGWARWHAMRLWDRDGRESATPSDSHDAPREILRWVEVETSGLAHSSDDGVDEG